MSSIPVPQRTASAVQLPLFSRATAARPDFDVHALSRPAKTFTGDFWYTRRFRDRLWFALGDVAGKGLPAAVVMAMVQEEIEVRLASCASMQLDPGAAVERLDAFLRPLLPANRFVTAVVGQLRRDGTLLLANAGHCPPLIVRRDGSVERVASTGPVVGILRSAAWRVHSTRLGRGETLALYSDGLLEARSPEGEELGVDGIARILAPTAALDARQSGAKLVETAAAFANGAREDDLTVLIVKR